MYFPYLRGKQNELLALTELAICLGETGNIIPIVEPVVSKMNGLRRTLKILGNVDAPFVLIANPQVGDLVGTQICPEDIGIQVGENSFLAYVITYRTRLKEIKQFLDQNTETQICFIHFAEFVDHESLGKLLSNYERVNLHIFIDGEAGQIYQDYWREYPRVLIRDSFRKARKNREYNEREDEFFSDLHLRYADLGLQGFGDFATIGRQFDISGGPAYSVALHYTYPDLASVARQVRIRHFVSDKLPDDPIDTAGKFGEALQKLIRFASKENHHKSCYACDVYRALHEQKDFPGLGPAKKLAIQHHLHVMRDLI